MSLATRRIAISRIAYIPTVLRCKRKVVKKSEASAARGCKKPRRISVTERHGGQHARGVSARVDADPSRRDDRPLCAWRVAMHDRAREAVSLAEEGRANCQHRLFRLFVERPVRIDAGVNKQIVAVRVGKRKAFEKAQMFGAARRAARAQATPLSCLRHRRRGSRLRPCA